MELLLYAVIFRWFYWCILVPTEQACTRSLLLPLIPNFTRDWLNLLCARRKFFIWIPSSFWPWSLASLISRSRRSRYYFRLKSTVDHPLLFSQCLSQPLIWAGQLTPLWLSLPLAACMAVRAALGPYRLEVPLAPCLSALAFPKRVSNILRRRL